MLGIAPAFNFSLLGDNSAYISLMVLICHIGNNDMADERVQLS